MKISEIYSAMGLKVKLNYEDSTVSFKKGVLVRIEPSQERNVFLVSQYGEGAFDDKVVLCKTSSHTADYLLDLFDGEHSDAYRCMFLIEGVEAGHIEVQTYTFQSVIEYKTPIHIIVPENLLEKNSIEKLYQDYVWNQLGMPALFCLNYKNKKKQNANIRFVGGKRYLVAQNTVHGIYAEKVAYLKEKYDVPVDVFVAPEIKFVAQSDTSAVNDALAADLEKISNPSSYFARWEAYDELSKKVLEAESEELGELSYSSYSFRTEVNGVTYEFIVNEELDDSFKGKELGASEVETIEEQLEKNAKRKRQIGVGQIKKISGNKIITFLEVVDNTDAIPNTGVLKLYTAGDRYIIDRKSVV